MENMELKTMTKMLELFDIDTDLFIDNLLAPLCGFTLDHK